VGERQVCRWFRSDGPWLVTADSVQNDSALRLWLEVDGQRHQDSSTAQMVFKPAFLVRYLSHFMSLQPGDLISTGTPPGVGLGVQTQRVVAHN
jgi:2,4-didehydro-3-deoxy-L-rhamnonate hydrolase